LVAVLISTTGEPTSEHDTMNEMNLDWAWVTDSRGEKFYFMNTTDHPLTETLNLLSCFHTPRIGLLTVDHSAPSTGGLTEKPHSIVTI